MDTSDNQLVNNILAGSNGSFVTLVERYNSQIYNLMYRYSGSSEDAADMTQDVFCKVFGKLASYRNQTSFFSWLYTLALNYAKDWCRKQRNYETKLGKFADELRVQQDYSGAEYDSRQKTDMLIRALDALSGDRRELVILRYRHECSIRELADIFQLSESAVKMRIKRSLEELKRILKNA
jgi:RNA polymerase sigma-70 factor (ECF subfamily)